MFARPHHDQLPDDSSARAEALRRFLRTRRARISPADVGLPIGKRRRAAGLRRQDVAELADISLGWYGRFEVGRAAHVSPQTVASIGRVLRLDATEMAYLLQLTSTEASAHAAAVSDPTAIETAQHVVRSFSGGPAYLMDRYYNVIAANAAATAILDLAPGRDNVLRKLFLDESSRSLYVDWDSVAEKFVAQMRLHYPGRLEDPAFVALVSEMPARSSHFARLWDTGVVATSFGQVMRIRRPGSDVISLTWTTFPVPSNADHVLALAPPADEASFRRVSALMESAAIDPV